MASDKYALVRVRYTKLSAGELAGRCEIHPELIDRFVRLGLFEPVAKDERSREWVFDEDIVPVVRKIKRLRTDLGLNYAAVGVVLDLLSRIDRLEARIRELQESD